MATWGLKVSDDLKGKLDKIKQESGLEGEEFGLQLLTLVSAEELKKEKPALAEELAELQTLTRRIYYIYLNSAERTENLIQSKTENFESALNELNREKLEIKNKLGAKEEELEALKNAYNDLAQDKQAVDNHVLELADTIKTKQELLDEYRARIDTLSGIVEEYKGFKDTNMELSKTLNENEKTINELTFKIRELESEAKRSREIINELNISFDSKIQELKEKHQDSLESLKLQHAYEIEKVKERSQLDQEKALLESARVSQKEKEDIINKFNEKVNSLQDKISTDNERFKIVLEELEKNRAALSEKDKNKK